MLARLVAPALLALAFASWHWSPTDVPAHGNAATVALADDDGERGSDRWTGPSAIGAPYLLTASLPVSFVLSEQIAVPTPARRPVAARSRAPPRR